eukprot:712117-Amphidinium_carterae.1
MGLETHGVGDFIMIYSSKIQQYFSDFSYPAGWFLVSKPVGRGGMSLALLHACTTNPAFRSGAYHLHSATCQVA